MDDGRQGAEGHRGEKYAFHRKIPSLEWLQAIVYQSGEGSHERAALYLRTMKSNIVCACSGLFYLASALADVGSASSLEAAVAETEKAFAATMANRDFEAFSQFLDEESVFFAGETPLRGKSEVQAAWKGFFEGPDAPFSWAPETVVVLESGKLALSSGPVMDPQGNRVATFQSIWRRTDGGE
ncbi:MAG: nuclear transport factor 2 family protein, partial [Xanthomonadales bacterium]|nr:nuclear transport factor 2 family protein [Xanthomonadales bacterium]